MAFVRINNLQEYKEFITNIQECFGCVEEWEEFFGFHLRYDDCGHPMETLDEYQGEIGCCPSKFPCVLYYLFDKDKDRLGPLAIKIFDWVTFEELGLGNANGN